MLDDEVPASGFGAGGLVESMPGAGVAAGS